MKSAGSAGTTRIIPSVTGAEMRTSPRTARVVFTAPRACSTSSRIRLARSCSAPPASVRASARVLRTSSGAPNSSSNART